MKRVSLIFAIIILSQVTYAIIPPITGEKPPQYVIEFQKMIQNYYPKGYFAEKLKTREETREKISQGILPESVLTQDTTFAITLLGQYSNLTAGYSRQDFQNLLFDGPNPTGTITDYYSEISYNQMLFTGDAQGWFNVPGTLEQYTGSNSGLGPNGGPRFVLDLIIAADPTINFADYIQYYDGQGRPRIGFIAAVHSGADAAAGAYNIWSHRWTFGVITGGQPYTTNDIDPVSGLPVMIDGDYAIQPERSGSNNTSGPLITIGVFAHEFGHIFGLPDLYDTDNSSEGLGNWCLMAGGAYGGNGNSAHTPVHMSAWCKKRLGWVTPVNITASIDSLSVDNVEENPVIYRMWRNGTIGLQYFLVENRQRIGFDRYNYEPGFLIYHIDEAMGGNQNENHYLVDLEQADGLRNLNNGQGRGDAGDPFPGSSNNRRFDINTNPNSKDYVQQNTFVSVRNIRKDGLKMVADFDIGTNPYIELNEIYISEFTPQNGRIEQGESGNVNFTLTNINPPISQNTTLKFFLYQNDIIINQNELTIAINGESSQSVTIDSAFTVDVNFEPRAVMLHYEIISEGNTIKDSLEIVIGIPKTLLISKSEEKSFSSYYRSSLMELGKYFEESFNQMPEFISQRDVIIIFTSRASQDIFTQEEIDAFSAFINNGGKILFTGQTIAEFLKVAFPDFLNNTIGIDWESNIIFPNYTYGIAGDFFGDQFNTLRIRGNGAANNQINPDVLVKVDSLFNFSHTYLSNGTKPAGGWIEKSNGAKIIFWGFGFEGIVDDQSTVTRTQILNSIYQWFEGSNDVENENPFTATEYKLFQNYPNPFNPTTNFEFRISNFGFVSLKIYDVLGSEVVTIVNEELPAGSYKYQWDASGLASGVYLYKLKTGDFVSTKKLILMK